MLVTPNHVDAKLWLVPQKDHHVVVTEPTREKYLLDLVITDMDSLVRTMVLPRVADHGLVLVNVKADVLETSFVHREYWKFAEADWTALQKEIMQTKIGV